jgi:predicted ATPase
MSLAETGELLLTALAPSGDEGERPVGEQPVRGCSIGRVLEQLGGADGRLSEQVEIAAAIDSLIDEGLVRRVPATDGQTALVPTEEGVQRATEVRAELARTPIDLVAGENRREVRLEAAATALDRPLVSIAADVSADRTYYCQDGPVAGRLLGREDERARWQELLERTRRDRCGGAVCLTGPGGIGKTTLAEEFLSLAREAGFDVVRARCRGPGSEPLEAVRTLVEQLDAEHDPVVERQVEVETPAAYDAHQQALFHELTDVLTPAVDGAARVCYLDDLHRADPTTRAYLDELLAALSTRPLLVLASVRPAECDGDDVFADHETGDDLVTRLPLEPLDLSGTTRLVEHVLDRRGVPESFATAVHEQTGGNPLFVEATVETLLETDRLDPRLEWYPTDAAALDVPTAVRETIDEHLTALDPEARQLVRRAAVAGEAVSIDTLDAVCALSRRHIETLLEVLVEGGLFAWQREGQSVTFSSAVLRDAVLDGIEPAISRQHHLETARALEEHAPDTADGTRDEHGGRAATIARHYEEANKPELAVEWYLDAVTAATSVYAHDTAITHCQRALDLARAGEMDDLLLTVGEKITGSYWTKSEFDEAERYVQFVRERTPEEDVARRQRLCHRAAQIAEARGEYETALAEARNGLELTETRSTRRCDLLHDRTLAELGQSDYGAATQTATDLRTAADALEEPLYRARGLNGLGRAAMRQCRNDEARAQLLDARTAFQEAGRPIDTGEVLTNLGIVAWKQGEHEQARTYYEQARDAFEAVGYRHGVGKIDNNLGNLARVNDTHAAAREHYERAITTLDTVGDEATAAQTRINLASLALRRGECERARSLAERALAVHQETGNQLHQGEALFMLGKIARHRGELGRARTCHRDALDRFEASGGTHYTHLVRIGLFSTERAADNGDEMAQLLEEVAAGLEETDVPHVTASYELRAGVLALRQDAYDDARAAFEAARDQYEAIEGDCELAMVEHHRARLAREEGALETARQRCVDALETFERLDSLLWCGRARHVLGTIEYRAGNPASAREHWKRALDRFETVCARRDALDSLERLLEAAAERDASERYAALCHRAGVLLDSAPDDEFEDARARLADWRSKRDERSAQK